MHHASIQKRKPDMQNEIDQHNVSDQLRLGALVLSVAAFFLFLYIDLCPQTSITILALGTLMLAWTGPLTMLAGLHMPRARCTYRVWQPFEGGFHFVSMQALGWSLMGLILAVCLVYLFNFHTLRRFEGQFLLIGIVGFITQMVLNVSLDCFIADAPFPSYATFPTSNKKSMVAILLSVSGCLFFLAFDWLLSSSVLVLLGATIFSVSAVVIHFGIGVGEIDGFSFWQPFVGGNVFMLLQYLGWKFYACTVVSASLLSNAEYYSGTASCMGVIGLISQLLLLSSLTFFDSSARLTAVLKPRQRLPAEVYVSGIVLVMTGIFSIMLYYDIQPVTCPKKTRILGLLCLMILGATTPLTHIGAHRSIQGYRLWQPFVGETKFIFIQSVGWTWYGIFVGVGILIILNDSSEFLAQLLPLACLLGTASCAAISFSLLFFDYIESNHQTSEYLSAELLLSFVLSCASILLHLVVEVLGLSGLLAALCLALGLVLSTLAMAVSQLAGLIRYPTTYRFWQPFVGGHTFVLRQALAWTFFAVCSLFDLVCVASLRHDFPIVRGFVLAVGLAVLIPQSILVSSLPHFQEPSTQIKFKSIIQSPVSWESLDLNMPLLTNFALVVGTLLLFIAAEFCRSYHSIGELFFACGTMAAVTAMACTHCICGPHMFPRYRMFQPFCGGLRFIVLQGAGWALGAVAWMAACTIIYWPSQFFQIDGLVLAVAAMFFSAHVLLLIALTAFDNTMTIPSTPLMPKPNLVLGVMVGIVASCLFALVDLFLLRYSASIPAFPTTVCAVSALVVSVPAVFLLQGGMVLRVLVCTLWSLTLLLGVIYTYSLWCEESSNMQREPHFFGVLTGSLGLVAQLVLLDSITPNTRQLLRYGARKVAPFGGVLGIAIFFFTPTQAISKAIQYLQPLPVLVLIISLCVYLISVLIFRLLNPPSTSPPPSLDLDGPILLHVASFLSPLEVASLASTSKHHQSQVTQAMWYTLYCKQVNASTSPLPHKRLNISTTELFAGTYLIAVERFLLRTLSKTKDRSIPLSSASSLDWKHVACLVSKGGALYHCQLCDEYAVFTASQIAWEREHACPEHSTSTWISSICCCIDPITCTPKVAHRRCLELQLTSSICKKHRNTLLPHTLRAPVTISELWQHVVCRNYNIFCFLAMIFGIFVLLPYCAVFFLVWVVGMILLGHVVQSRAFDRAVQLIWNDPFAFPLYIRIYYTMALSSVILLMTPLWNISSTSTLLIAIFIANTIFFSILTLSTVCLFWKSNAAIMTVANQPVLSSTTCAVRCGLCRLHLCHTIE